jgi:ABC-2 type transport system ATP-binding protein
MSNEPIVEVHGVTKRFAGHTAVHDLSLNIPRGAIYGLLGPNGAGKTTTIRMIMSIILPDEGQIALFGGRGSGKDLSHRIGYLPEERGLYKKMRVLDLLVFLAEIKGVARSQARRSAQEWLGRLGLADWAAKKADALSKGMQQKVQFIGTVLHKPELLILDEPFAGLDPVNSQVMKDTVVDLARAGTTVLFSTHIMEQAEKLCDAVCIIARGEKVVDGPLAEVKRRHGGSHVVVAVERGSPAVQRVFEDRALIAKADDYGNYAELELASGADPQRLLWELVHTGAAVTRFEIAEPTLNKIFIDLVGPEAAAPRAVEEKVHA